MSDDLPIKHAPYKKLVCPVKGCEKSFVMLPSEYNDRMKKSKSGHLFCSRNCAMLYREGRTK